MIPNFYSAIGKRWFDAICALAGLVVLAPILLLVALAVRVSSRGPAFYRQGRTGQFGKPFRIFKFRTMRVQDDANQSLLTAKGDARITPLGSFLRHSKVDELPQLINVFLGDMSLVGPRPEVPVYTAKYTARQKSILCERPGITGLSAVAYADEECILASETDKEGFYVGTLLPAKLELDIAYCKDITFVGDLRLISATISKVLRGIFANRKIHRSLAKNPQFLD
ncbi:MAG TPA: sugar transferase [Candidatus Acidoferrum sp.]|nr:sugar transferase [Candidatus Acidoferrum sp.]